MKVEKEYKITFTMTEKERVDFMDMLRASIADAGKKADGSCEQYADILYRQRDIAGRILEALK